jgi:uncharacterized iron-regulated membrane protein
MGRRQFALHRWLTAIISLQLFLWSLGGLIFATHDIDWVRGEDGRNHEPKPGISIEQLVVSPADAIEKSGLSTNVDTVEIRRLLERTVYEIRSAESVVVVDALNGHILSPIDSAMAKSIALRDRAVVPVVHSVVLLEDDPPMEYRGRPLPVWRVTLDDDDETHVYVAADSGRITARRNNAWRRFDFFWMLHTMDYGGRDNFNSLLLIFFAGLGLLAVLSGWVLWAARLRKRFRRRSAGPRDDQTKTA